MSHQVNVDPLLLITNVKLHPIPAYYMHPSENGEATTLTYICTYFYQIKHVSSNH